MAADSEATLPSLIEACKRLITADRKRALEERGKKLATLLCAECHLSSETDRLTGRHMKDLPKQFGEVYFSKIYPGVIKGWHVHKVMTQNYAVPIGRIKGLPIGGQLIGQAFLEDEMLEAAYALERAVPATEEA